MLSDSGHLVKEEAYTSQIGYSERTNAVIEPKLSLQWFLKMGEASENALDYIESDKIRLIPDKYKNTYRHWMENAHDWCISRQLWWGQRIPAWYLPNGDFVVESNEIDALKAAKLIDSSINVSDLNQDEDVLDTWFSSWLWPISVFDANKPGFPDKEPNKELSYYYPTNDLVTAPEILFFWVARMVMAGHEFCGDIPFRNVYLTGIVRDKSGRKMSKSLGNSPDPIELIKTYGADGVRVGMLLCSSAGNDILFDESQVEQGRNFSNKIWNAYRLIQGWTIDNSLIATQESELAVEWFDNLLSQSIETMNDHFDKFRLSDALMLVYKLFWDDFCAWYLEIIKPVQRGSMDTKTYNATIEFLDKLLKLLHPFMPFITEELWHNISERTDGESIMVLGQPNAKRYSTELLRRFEQVKMLIVNIRSIRQSKGISPKESLELFVKGDLPDNLYCIIKRMANISDIKQFSEKGESLSGTSFMVETIEFFIPLGSLVNVQEEINKIEAEIIHLQGFLASVNLKLSNSKFVCSAPKAVVELEQKKQSDSLSKIDKLTKLKAELKK